MIALIPQINTEEQSSLLAIVVSGLVGSLLISSISVSSALLYLVLLWAGLLLVRGKKNKVEIFSYLMVINSICILLLYLIYLVRYETPYYLGGSDDLYFERLGKYFADRFSLLDYSAMHYQVLESWEDGGGYIYLINILYRLGNLFGGFHTLMPRIFNGFLLSLIASFSYSMMKELAIKDKRAKLFSFAIGGMPIMVYVSSHSFRDLSVLFVMFLMIYLITCCTKTDHKLVRAFFTVSVVIIGMIYIGETRSTFFPVFAIVLFGALFDRVNTQNNSSENSLGVLSFFALLTLSAVAFAVMWIFMEEKILGYAVRYTEYSLEQSSGFSRFVFGQPILPFGFVSRVLYLVVNPVPVFSSKIEEIWLSLGTIIQVVCLPFFLIGLRKMVRRRLLFIPFCFVIFYGMVALTTFTFRHFIFFFPFGVIVTAYGINDLSIGKITRKIIEMIMIILLIGVGFLFIKL